ncbi:hypothetical protein [Paraburkholderia youngii]|uniref:hypothetical protein n=1 Tax=Paraburkholderia youngii TaxID=2782701 RepID=UPI001590F958|nr:hypothetical protein [Paraburkholderia youngii]NUX59500.1 hypothetical protein [Paraburkholderia youngii]
MSAKKYVLCISMAGVMLASGLVLGGGYYQEEYISSPKVKLQGGECEIGLASSEAASRFNGGNGRATQVFVNLCWISPGTLTQSNRESK